jgi:hypothetical protein
MPIEVLQPPLRDEPPSTYAIAAFMQGQPGSLGRVVNLTLSRMVFIAPGLYIAGIREPRELLKMTASVSVSLTAGLALLYRLHDDAAR